MKPDTTMQRRWWQCVVVLGTFGSACLAPIAVIAQDGVWTRTARSGGETWIYRFTVAGGPNPAGSAPVAGAPSDRGGEAARTEARVGDRRVEGPPVTAAGSAAAAVDIEAERAYLNTAAGGEGSEVTTPAVGQTVYFHLDFSVVGSGGAIALDRRAIIDGQTFCDFSGSPTPGAYLTWCTDGWTVTAGTHTLRWDLDYDNTVAETNESNNSATFMFTSAPAGTVDLEAQRAYLNTMPSAAGDDVATPAVGQAVYFHLDYSLIGSGGAVAVERRAVLDGQTFCSFIGSPTPGDYLTWCADSWPATAGSHTLRWDLDFNNTVPESNEDNNSVSTTWTSGTGACTGDCSGDGEVTVNELITMVNVALGNTAASACSAGDANGDGEITVNEIVAGVNRALSGCG